MSVRSAHVCSRVVHGPEQEYIDFLGTEAGMELFCD